MKIKFSIITPTYNRLKSGFLEECIESVRNQKEGDYDYEHIVVDDGSSDLTFEFLQNEAKNDKHLVALKKKNGGTASAVREGIKVATGNYVTVIGDDDKLSDDSLYVRAEYIRKNPEVDWFYARSEFIDENGEKIKPPYENDIRPKKLYENMLIANFIPGGTPVLKKELYSTIEWPSWLKRSEDYYVWLELLRPERKLKVGFLDKVVFRYRWHPAMHTLEITANDEAYSLKEELNERIRRLHPDSLSYLASEAYRYKRLYGKYGWLVDEYPKLEEKLKEKDKVIAEQSRELIAIKSSRGWKLIAGIRRILGKER